MQNIYRYLYSYAEKNPFILNVSIDQLTDKYQHLMAGFHRWVCTCTCIYICICHSVILCVFVQERLWLSVCAFVHGCMCVCVCMLGCVLFSVIDDGQVFFAIVFVLCVCILGGCFVTFFFSFLF